TWIRTGFAIFTSTASNTSTSPRPARLRGMRTFTWFTPTKSGCASAKLTSALPCLGQAARWRLVRFNASWGAGRKDENVGQSKSIRRAFIANIVHYSGVFDESCSRGVVMAYAIRFIERRCTLANRDDDRARMAVPATIPAGRQRLVRNQDVRRRSLRL